MWRWIRHWHDWAMSEIVTPHRMVAQPQALYFSCEKAGLVLHNQPIPWGAESVLVEALLRLPPAARKKADFNIRLPGYPAVPVESMRKDDLSDRYRLFFRINPPAASTTAELFWRRHRLGKIDLPLLTAEEFVRDLQILLPTIFVSLAGKNVAAQSFVASQCKSLTASAVIRSPTGLAPLLDLGLSATFRWERSSRSDIIAVPLVSSQLNGKEALISVSPPKLPRRAGDWTLSWMVGERVLAGQRARAVSPKTFLDSLRVADTRFVVNTDKSGLRIVRQLPPLEELRQAAPCFVICSNEPGMAGLATVQIKPQMAGDVPAPEIAEQTILITDGPTLISPKLLSVKELESVIGFEIRHKLRLLGTLPLSPVPLATLTGEGGFKPPSDFLWNNTAEDELLEKLSRLMDVGS